MTSTNNADLARMVEHELDRFLAHPQPGDTLELGPYTLTYKLSEDGRRLVEIDGAGSEARVWELSDSNG